MPTPGSMWICGDCGWRWLLADVPWQDSECDRCGGTMHPVLGYPQHGHHPHHGFTAASPDRRQNSASQNCTIDRPHDATECNGEHLTVADT